MYQPDPLETMRSMAQLFHVRLHLFRPPYKNLEELDFSLRQRLFAGYDYHNLLDLLRSNLKPGATHSEKDVFENWYCAFSLDTGGEAPPYEFAVLGPYRYKACTPEDAEIYLQKSGLPPYLKDDLSFAVSRVPVIENRNLWLNMLVALIAPLITQDGNLRYRTRMDEFSDFSGFSYAQASHVNEYSQLALSGGYALEQELVKAVKKNQVRQACLAGFRYLNFQIAYHKQYGLNPLQALSAMNAILRYASMEAGVNALRLDDIYVKYEKSIRGIGLQIVPQPTCTEMITDYCKLVEQYAYPNYSTAVRQAVDYIDFHYFEEISLRTLAEMLNISSGYLCTLFRKETGTSVTAYIQKTRINHAAQLLESTDLSVQEVGMRCGFADASYFTKIFKKEKSISPAQYRAQRKML